MRKLSKLTCVTCSTCAPWPVPLHHAEQITLSQLGGQDAQVEQIALCNSTFGRGFSAAVLTTIAEARWAASDPRASVLVAVVRLELARGSMSGVGPEGVQPSWPDDECVTAPPLSDRAAAQMARPQRKTSLRAVEMGGRSAPLEVRI